MTAALAQGDRGGGESGRQNRGWNWQTALVSSQLRAQHSTATSNGRRLVLERHGTAKGHGRAVWSDGGEMAGSSAVRAESQTVVAMGGPWLGRGASVDAERSHKDCAGGGCPLVSPQRHGNNASLRGRSS